jgi:twitching motility protein PilT
MAQIDELFHKMVALRASDLHLTSTKKPCVRVDGDVKALDEWPELAPDDLEEILFEITPDKNREEFTQTGDTDFAYELAEAGRFRGNLFRDRFGPGGVFRLIPNDILTLDQLGMPPVLRQLCCLSKGLVLVTGPTGSGKSTTLAAMIDYINKARQEHIITIEDPIEFVHENQSCIINQREVHRHTKSFKRALRAALREDPDIVMVGEMRDLETIEIALETAETGHLVFGTLHTTTAASTVDRIVDQFPADRQAQIRVMVSNSLKGVVAQTLCRRKPKGRVAALEIMIANTAVAANIREGKTHQLVSAIQMGRKDGMQLLNDALYELVKDGLVEAEEAYMKSVSKDDLLMKFKSGGIDYKGVAAEPGTTHAPAAAPAAASTPKPAVPSRPAPAPARPAAATPAPAPAARPATPSASPGSPGYVDPFDQFKTKKKPY